MVEPAREEIARTALRIVDEDGPDALSFRTLGRALGVSHMTVVRRCDDFAGLLDLCVDHLAAGLPDLDPATPWAESTEARFRALYAILARHPGIVTLRRGRPWLGPRVLARLVEPQMGASLAAGMTPRQAIASFRRLYLYTLGCAGFVDHRNPRGAVRRTRVAVAALPAEDFPHLTAHLDTILEAVVDHEVYYEGLRQLIAAASQEAAAARGALPERQPR